VKITRKNALPAIAMLAIAPAASAAINYGDFAGTDVMYLDVTEAALTGDPEPLYGAPIVSGNALDFNNMTYASSSSGAGGSDFTDGRLTTTIMSINAGVGITDLLIEESGDYSLIGPGGTGTSAFVGASIFLDIREIDGVPIAPINFNTNLVISPNADGEFNIADDGTGVAVIWEGTILIDIDAILAANSIVGTATKIDFTMDNVLGTTSEAGTSSLITKKDLGGVAITTMVPAPGTLVLLAAGLLAPRRRRRA
jgi:hypothetical protein